MLSKSDSKFIKSLQLKKFRKAHNLFVNEGEKNLRELLKSDYQIDRLLLTEDFYNKERTNLASWFKKIEIVKEKDLISCGTFQSNTAGLAVVEMRQQIEDSTPEPLTLALENIRDPGNLGTIIRIADWYGLTRLICSPTCTDCFNSKVINSSMGSFFRVGCHYLDLHTFLSNSDIPIYGASLGGQDLHQFKFKRPGIIVIGNESSGLSNEIKPLITTSLEIPRYGQAESLNAAMATAIFCDNYFRQIPK